MRAVLLVLLCLLAVALAARQPLEAASQSAALSESWHSLGAINGEEWGGAVAGAGDVNGDGYDDILVGAPKYGSDREGGAFAFYGGPDGLRAPARDEVAAEIADWRSTGEKGSRYGAALAGAGDLNCDGFGDIVVGAPSHKNETTTAGAVFVFYGSAGGLPAEPDWYHVFDQAGAEFGYSVAGAGDANDDGCDDLLVGARYYENGQENEGAILLFYGSDSGLGAAPDWKAEGPGPGAAFGTAVGGLGDFNGDGIDDFVGGAPFADGPGMPQAGALLVFYGSSSGPTAHANWQVFGEQADANLGFSAGAAGDVNGDGFGDLLGGMPGYGDVVYQDYGVALVFHGERGEADQIPDARLVGEQVGSGHARAAAGVGDVNADGYDDILVGAPTYTGDQSKEGAIFLYLGGEAGLSTQWSWSTQGNKADTEFGMAVAGAGNVDGDFGDDFLAGAPLFREATMIVGRAAAYYGLSGSQFFSVYVPFVTHTP